jgi:3'-phosphoadenosine 5'-phosphosulfate (PAPS) 3'-phosphatase
MEYQIKDIPGFEGKYQATTTGEIFSLKNKKFLSKGDDTYGYDTCNLEGKTYKVHKLIGMTFLDNPNSHIQIDHTNRNRKDNNVSNLRYVSSSENQNNKRPYAKKSPELRNIQVKKSTFKVTVVTKGKPTIHKSFKTLEEAQTFRDKILTEKKTPEQPVAL